MQEMKSVLREGKGKQRGASQAELDQRNAEMDKIYDAYEAVAPKLNGLEAAMKKIKEVDTSEGQEIYQMWMELRDRVQANTGDLEDNPDKGWYDDEF